MKPPKAPAKTHSNRFKQETTSQRKNKEIQKPIQFTNPIHQPGHMCHILPQVHLLRRLGGPGLGAVGRHLPRATRSGCFSPRFPLEKLRKGPSLGGDLLNCLVIVVIVIRFLDFKGFLRRQSGLLFVPLHLQDILQELFCQKLAVHPPNRFENKKPFKTNPWWNN